MRLNNIARLIVGGSLLLNIGFSGHGFAVSRSHKVCAQVRAGQMRCLASVLTDSGGIEPYSVGSPRGYGPADWRSAYGPTSRSPAHVAIVAAYDENQIA